MNHSNFQNGCKGFCPVATIMNNGAGGWIMVSMWLLSVLFRLLIIAGVVLIVRWLTGRDGQGKASPKESPPDTLDILKTRYAKGETGKAEFKRKKPDLEN